MVRTRLTTKIPDVKPFTIGRFTFTQTGVEVNGQPSFAEFEGAIEFANRAHKCAAWWVADLTAYGERRADWQERLSQVADASGYDEETVKNIKYVGESVAPARRRADLSFSVHSEVAKLTPKEQTHWLEEAASHGWSVRDLRHTIESAGRAIVLEGQADTMHSVEVSVLLDLEAKTPYAAEQAAWELVKKALAAQKVPFARVIAAHARPHRGTKRGPGWRKSA